MKREQMIEALTKYELEWLMENQDHLKEVAKFLAQGGFNACTDEELLERCRDNCWLEVEA